MTPVSCQEHPASCQKPFTQISEIQLADIQRSAESRSRSLESGIIKVPSLSLRPKWLFGFGSRRAGLRRPRITWPARLQVRCMRSTCGNGLDQHLRQRRPGSEDRRRQTHRTCQFAGRPIRKSCRSTGFQRIRPDQHDLLEISHQLMNH